MVLEKRVDSSKESQMQDGVITKEPKMYSLESILSKLLPS